MMASASTWVASNLWIGGAVIVAVVIVLTLWIAVDSFRRGMHAGRQRNREAQLLKLRVKQVEARIREDDEKHRGSWSGWRKFEITAKACEDPAGLACSFYLTPHDRKPIPKFEPGQFLTFQVDVPGHENPPIRCYSLSDAPKDKPDHYRVTIKRIRAMNDSPAGAVSNFFHEKLDVGDIVDVRAPSGKFFLDLAWETPVVLLSAGVGITPVLSMLNAIADSNSSRETWFFYGVPNREEHIMYDHLERVAREHENVHLRVCYSHPREGVDVEGRDYHHKGWVSTELLKQELQSGSGGAGHRAVANYQFYMCGPPPMMDSLKDGLAELGVPKQHVHFEKFSPPRKPPAPAPAPEAGAATGPDITFEKSGRTIPWDPNFASILDFAEANGIEIESQCRVGNCGTCLTAIKNETDGEGVQYTDDVSYPYEAKTCLTCSCVPTEPLVLDA